MHGREEVAGGLVVGMDCRISGGASSCRMVSLPFLDREWGVEWIVKLTVAGGEGPCVDITEISKPDDLDDIANLGLTITEAKRLARVQREISTAQGEATRGRAAGLPLPRWGSPGERLS
jgi:hypothetical protein